MKSNIEGGEPAGDLPNRERQYEYLFRLYYASLFQTIAIVLGLTAVTIQVVYYLSTSARGNETLAILLFIIGIAMCLYAARYVAALYQLNIVMDELKVSDLDRSILDDVDLLFIWLGKGSAAPGTAKRRLTQRAWRHASQLITIGFGALAYVYLLGTLAGWSWGVAFAVVVTAAVVCMISYRVSQTRVPLQPNSPDPSTGTRPQPNSGVHP